MQLINVILFSLITYKEKGGKKEITFKRNQSVIQSLIRLIFNFFLQFN